jgi:hypothetical protein
VSAVGGGREEVMLDSSFISSLPNVPSVYALYGGTDRSRYVAYVGLAGKLKQRITQHLIRRDSSITTGATAVSLNPDKVSEIRWWEHDSFGDSDLLTAAEVIAFEVLDPVLRSRGSVSDKAREMTTDANYKIDIRKLFEGPPSGCLIIPNLKAVLERVAALEKKLASKKR